MISPFAYRNTPFRTYNCKMRELILDRNTLLVTDVYHQILTLILKMNPGAHLIISTKLKIYTLFGQKHRNTGN